MKSLLLISLGIASSLLLSSCGKDYQPFKKKSANERTKYYAQVVPAVSRS